jgi:hypothetical protein
MSNNDCPSRRQFLGKAGLFIFGAAPLTASISALAQAGKLKPVVESEAQAQSLGYKSDATKVDTKKFPKRAGAEGAKQFCYNCQFYQTKAADPKATKAGPCLIFGGRDVEAKAWCNSWAQNPKVKS